MDELAFIRLTAEPDTNSDGPWGRFGRRYDAPISLKDDDELDDDALFDDEEDDEGPDDLDDDLDDDDLDDDLDDDDADDL